MRRNRKPRDVRAALPTYALIDTDHRMRECLNSTRVEAECRATIESARTGDNVRVFMLLGGKDAAS